MPEREAPVRAFYDHESEESPATGRRRRPVADWGVGEDVFDRMPSRRFTRADDRRPHAQTRVRGGEETRGEETPRRAEPRGGAEPPRSPAEPVDAAIAEPPAAERPAAPRAGRRTIVIGGHPEGAFAPRPRRPPLTAAERIGPRPDRIVAYMVALGFLLILIAILSAGH